jgi:hypothetical protein
MGLASMFTWDAVGYLASGLVFAAFCMKDITPLRIVAVGSNFAFLVYGLAFGLVPVWLLHALLLPINCWRLWQGVSQTFPNTGSVWRPESPQPSYKTRRSSRSGKCHSRAPRVVAFRGLRKWADHGAPAEALRMDPRRSFARSESCTAAGH